MGDLILDGVVCVVDCRNILKVCHPPLIIYKCLAALWRSNTNPLWLMRPSNWPKREIEEM